MLYALSFPPPHPPFVLLFPSLKHPLTPSVSLTLPCLLSYLILQLRLTFFFLLFTRLIDPPLSSFHLLIFFFFSPIILLFLSSPPSLPKQIPFCPFSIASSLSQLLSSFLSPSTPFSISFFTFFSFLLICFPIFSPCFSLNE